MNVEEYYNELMRPENIIILIGIFILRLIVWGLFAWNIKKTILLIQPENRCLLPNQVWGLMVPLYNIYWNFQVARMLTDSLNNEFYDRKIAVEENPTLKVGLIYAWLYLAANIPLPQFLLLFTFILSLVYFINYWIKISTYKNLLITHNQFKDNEVFKNED